MKFVKSLSFAIATLALSSPVLAQSATKSVTVDATLTSVCQFDSGLPVALTANYTAFTATPVAPTGDVLITCTRSKTPLSMTVAGGNIGTVGGLVFELSVGPWQESQPGVAPLGASISDLGTPLKGKFVVTANFPAGQAGTVGTTTPVTRALTITF